MCAGPPTASERAMRSEERGWEQAKRRLHDDGSAAWAQWCGRRVRKAPREMRRKLMASRDFGAVQRSSAYGRRKKTKNAAAAGHLRDFLTARAARERDGRWLTQQRNANPKLASQWVAYLERTEHARERLGPGTSFILMD